MEAVLRDGPLKGTKVEIEAVGGRPPSTIKVSDPAGEDVRYCLAEWTQEGMSAEITSCIPFSCRPRGQASVPAGRTYRSGGRNAEPLNREPYRPRVAASATAASGSPSWAMIQVTISVD